jgi:predicted XRE-type DNA-binding protein
MKSKKFKKIEDFAKEVGLSKERGKIAEIKALLTYEIIKAIDKQDLTHQNVADLSEVPRSAITGIVTGSLQKVTLDRLVRILTALGKSVELKVRNAA